MYINAKAKQANTYDAIVVGSGISGGWAAKELTEKGLKTLVLERGRNVEHVKDYPTATKAPWEFPHRDRVSPEEIKEHYPKQSRTGYTIRESSKHWFVKDSEHPYQEDKRFDWMRGYHVGGRSIMWGRHSYRWSDLDFEANARDGYGVDWPIRYKDIAPWYDYVESFAGIQGQKEGLSQLPDGNFLPPIPMNCLEDHFKNKVAEKLDGRIVTIGRTANLTQDHNGRTKCQFRNKCIRGCPYGAYFSSNSSTLPAAAATGNLTVRPFSIASSIIYDKESKKATGVRVIDQETMEELEFHAKVIFLCASAIPSTSILLNSKSDAFPEGMGNTSGELGHNLMDHHFRVGASGVYEGFSDKYYYGRRPTGFYIPRFRNLDKNTEQKDYLRGYGYQGGASRENWTSSVRELNFGAGMKEGIVTPGPWSLGMTAFGECLPYHENKMTLDYDNLDKWGQPTVRFDADFKENEKAMRKDMEVAAAEMLEAAGLKNINTYDAGSWPGLGIHEMGTARMGKDPKTSVLNKNNQLHEVPNVYVTDGACMTSASCVNPSLTYMALTARAAEHAVNELKKMNI
ncbi:GMC family oxidoreductase [Porifericola rhodea]|uniref:GMC oxidoreductase n=1 Tax=Porifericola rhodea TaxID=930972 RepID=UPI00266647DB|nr:GMC family oxidoreductase [Porifericola rhodea]WKN32899.1 GMC family oxidoreductase [Porifericola rhodea]